MALLGPLFGSMTPLSFSLGGGSAPPPPPPPPPPPSAPSVSLTAPSAGGTSTSLPVTVSADATANSPATSIASVQFRIAGVTFATDNSGPPWSVSWSPDNGTYTIDAVATDNLGGVATSTSRTHTVSVSPAAGSEIGEIAYYNTTGSAISANMVTRMFGMQYRMADLPTGDYPVFELADGTPVASNTMMETTHVADGSMLHASHLLRVPVGISAASRTFTISSTTITLANQTGLTNGDAVVLTSTQVMRRPFLATEIYYVRLGSSNTATFHSSAAAAIAGTGAILPSTVAGDAGSGTFSLHPAVVIKIKNGGSAPSASGFDTSTITGASDIKVTLDGLANISGANTAALNTGISDGGANVFSIGDGPVGRVYRVYQEFNNGSDNALAGVMFYVQALKNSSGGLYGLRVWPECRNGWDDVSSPTLKTLAVDNILVKNGSTTITTPTFYHAAAVTFTASGASFTAASAFTSTGGVAQNASIFPQFPPCRLSTTGTLPTGVDSSTTYWMRPVLGTTGFTLHATLEEAAANVNHISVSGGSGTHSFNVKPWIGWYAMGPALVGTDGEYIFLAGTGGTGSEAAGSIVVSAEYRVSTKALPPYKTDALVGYPATHVTYQLGAAWGWPGNGMTGAHELMGSLDTFTVEHLINNNARTDHRARTAIIPLARKSFCRRDTLRPVNVSHQTYTGLGAGQTSWSCNQNSLYWVGAPAPAKYASHGSYEDAFLVGGWTHATGLPPGAFMLYGEPQYLDMLIDNAVYMAGNGDPYSLYETSGHPVVSGTTYYRIISNRGVERQSGWCYRDGAYAALFCPPTWNGAPVREYLQDLLENDAAYCDAKFATHPTFYKNKKYPNLFAPNDGDAPFSPWASMFLLGARIIGYKATGNSSIKSHVERRLEFANNLRLDFGLPYVTPFIYYLFNGAMDSWDFFCASDIWGTTYAQGSTDYIFRAQVLVVDANPSSNFTVGVTVTNTNNGATAVCAGSSVNGLSQWVVYVIDTTGDFLAGHTITSSAGGASRTMTEDKYVEGDTISNIPTLPADWGTFGNGVRFANIFSEIPGLTPKVNYWIRDWDATRQRFKLSTTSALSDVVDITSDAKYPTSGYVGSTLTGGLMTGATGEGSIVLSTTSVFQAILGYTRFAKAAGMTIPTGLLEALEAEETAEGIAAGGLSNYTGNTAYAFKDSY